MHLTPIDDDSYSVELTRAELYTIRNCIDRARCDDADNMSLLSGKAKRVNAGRTGWAERDWAEYRERDSKREAVLHTLQTLSHQKA